MKKLLLFLFIAVFASGCSSQTSKTSFNEKDFPNIQNNDESGLYQRINEIKMGATPKESPNTKTSPALGEARGSQGESNSQMQIPEQKSMQLENLAQQFKFGLIKTNLGDIKVAFYATESPVTVNNFLNLAKKGFYDGVKFHRVITDFMIQTGDPLSKDDDPDNDGTGGPGYKFQDEINGYKLVKGSLAMANSGPNTNGSQFFIVTKEATPWLDGKHTNFGYVVEGLDVALKIDQVPTGVNDRPIEDVVINSIELLN